MQLVPGQLVKQSKTLFLIEQKNPPKQSKANKKENEEKEKEKEKKGRKKEIYIAKKEIYPIET